MVSPDIEKSDMKFSEAATSESDAREELPQSIASRLSRRVAIMAVVGLTAVYLVSIFYMPSGSPDGEYFTICGFKNVTGLPCPGCGLTHSFCALCHGDMTSAFAYNLLGPPLFLFSVFIWIRSICLLAGWTDFSFAFDRIVTRLRPARAFMIAFLLFGVGRIIYLCIYKPSIFSDSPLAQLIEIITH